MIISDDRQLTSEERAEISKRKIDMETQKKLKKSESLSDLKKELGIPEEREK